MNKTRYWVKLDSKGKPILGVLEARPKKPIGGEWMEVNLRPCCLISALIPVPDTGAVIIIVTCGGDTVFSGGISGDADAVVADWNSNFAGIGTLSHDGTYYYLQSTICPDLTLTVESD